MEIEALLIKKLKIALPNSTENHRKNWAKQIVDGNINLFNLCSLLKEPKPVASRFLWLLSDVGQINPNHLQTALPHILEQSKSNSNLDFSHSLARYWLLAGIPTQNETEAIDLLFGWLQSSTSKVFLKSNCMLALAQVCKKYPDLKNELRAVIEKEMHLHSESFKKRAKKVLLNME